MCLTMIHQRRKIAYIIHSFILRRFSSCGTLLVGGFPGADIVAGIDDGSLFWVSTKIEGNGCLLIIKRVLFPFLFKNRSSK